MIYLYLIKGIQFIFNLLSLIDSIILGITLNCYIFFKNVKHIINLKMKILICTLLLISIVNARICVYGSEQLEGNIHNHLSDVQSFLDSKPGINIVSHQFTRSDEEYSWSYATTILYYCDC